MKDSFYGAVMALGKVLIKGTGIHVVCNLQICQVAKLVALCEIVHRDDVGDAACIESFDQIAANEAGRAGDDDTGHAINSLKDTVAVPNLATTSPPARLASGRASRMLSPAATSAASVAMTVSPAPVTSNTSSAWALTCK